MMQLHAEAFRLYQRDIHWLKGLSNASQKVRNFEPLLNRLVYQPWTLQKEHIDVWIKFRSILNVISYQLLILVITNRLILFNRNLLSGKVLGQFLN